MQEPSIIRPGNRVGGAIVFAASLVAVLFFVPALLWPTVFAAGVALIMVALRGEAIPRRRRRTFVGVGALLSAVALVPFLDLALSGGVLA
ncbi:MAG: hypothetical protein QM708_01020 [Propioniciclava sp.]|uniref:hypothetical protein n=1 Tax=Propioniciclava sp. TaxID=2038686 RepID=UPI0039E374C7